MSVTFKIVAKKQRTHSSPRRPTCRRCNCSECQCSEEEIDAGGPAV
jgi:hypothetical protein